ncbi:hypothetical protein B0H10DRAFT_110426 [Mycena sp. CBHHK59/15]|nr:hypothetical protein B0H10DRAFT_110426 [Mycena sp. CBHHK59/15]
MEATFDDGAMVNVIDTATFDSVHAQLSDLSPSPRVLRMANGVLVPSGGSWRGKIAVRGVSAIGKFEIFPGGGVWQMLLGKPMLQAFGASHEYVNDTVTLQTAAGAVTLQNGLAADAKGTRQNKVAIAHVSDPGECLGISPLGQRQVDDTPTRITVDHALNSQESAESAGSGGIEINEPEWIGDGSRTPEVAVAHASDPGACITCLPPPSGQVPPPESPCSVDAGIRTQMPSYSARKRARKATKTKRAEERVRAREALLLVWTAMEKNPVSSGTKSFQRRVRRIKTRRDQIRRMLLRRWYATPWDAGAPLSRPQSTDIESPAGPVDMGPAAFTADGKASVQEVQDMGDEQVSESEGLRKHKVAVASASNPGECCGTSPLRPKEVTHIHSAACAYGSTEQWTSIGELESAEADGL